MLDLIFSIFARGALLLFMVGIVILLVIAINHAIRVGWAKSTDDSQNVSITINFKDTKKDK